MFDTTFLEEECWIVSCLLEGVDDTSRDTLSVILLPIDTGASLTEGRDQNQI